MARSERAEKLTDRFLAKYQRSADYPPSKTHRIPDTDIGGFALVVRPTGTMSYVLRYRSEIGARVRDYTIGRSTNISAANARKAALRLSGQTLTGTDIQDAKQEARAKAERDRMQTLQVFFEEKYIPYCEGEMRNGRGQISAIRAHFVKRWPSKPLTDINAFLVQNWRRERLKSGISAGGVNRPVSAIKAMLNRAVEWGVIESNPLKAVKPVKEDSGRKVRFLEESEETRLRVALDTREDEIRLERQNHNRWLEQRGKEQRPDIQPEDFADYLKPLVLLALNTGLRRGELFNLVADDLQLNYNGEGRVLVRGAGSKSGNSRSIPLTNEAKQILTTWIGQTQPKTLVFPSPVTGSRLDNINRSWAGIVARARLENFRFHDLRHTFASKLAMRGVDLYTIKEFLGHASIETTQRYAHLAPNHKSRAIATLNT